MARILIAEDEMPVREFLRRALEQRGHAVTAVTDGAEAMAKLARGQFDVLLADIVMPNMDGVELALKATRDYPQMAVLLMTGYAVEPRRIADLADLVRGVIRKPIGLADLCLQVEAALAKTVAQ